MNTPISIQLAAPAAPPPLNVPARAAVRTMRDLIKRGILPGRAAWMVSEIHCLSPEATVVLARLATLSAPSPA